MSSVTVLDFFRANVPHPRGYPFIDHIEWSKTGGTPVFSIVPLVDRTIMIRSIIWTLSGAAQWNSSYSTRLQITQLNTPPVGSIDLTLPDSLAIDGVGSFGSGYVYDTGNALKTSLIFDPPIKLDGLNEHVQIQLVGSNGQPYVGDLQTGWLIIAVSGWTLLTANY
jgi:hypothetical protein